MKQLTVDSNNALKVFTILFLMGLWLMLERYHGFYHDGILYSMLAMFQLHPDNFRNDLFVAYGAQDAFTIFSPLYAWIIKLTSLDMGAFILTACAQVLWLIAIWYLIRRIAKGWSAIAGFACLVYFSRYYDTAAMFSYAEPFPTPRPIAEALTLFSIAHLLDRRYAWSLLCIIGATIFHPLMSLFGGVLLVASFCLDKRISAKFRLAIAIGILFAAILLVGFKVVPFAGLFRPYDDDWFRVFTIFRVKSLCVWLWTFPQILRLVYFVLILGIAWWRKIPILGSRIPLIVGCELALIGVWALGTGLWHDQLLMQLQLWRAAWLVQVLALVAQGILLIDLWSSGSAARWLAGLMLAALLQLGYANSDGTYACCALFAGLVVYALLQRLPTEKLKNPIWALLPILLPVPQLLSNIARAWPIRMFFILRASGQDWLNFIVWAVAGSILAFTLLVILKRVSIKRDINILAGSMAGMSFLAGSLYIWSNAYLGSTTRLDEANQKVIGEMQNYIPPKSVVFGNNGLMWAWFVLQRSYYIDGQQIGNSVFTRSVALEGNRRIVNLCMADVPGCQAANYVDKSRENPSAFWQAHAPVFCQDPVLDFVILSGIELPGSKIFRVGPNGQPTSVFACRPYHVGHDRFPAGNEGKARQSLTVRSVSSQFITT